MEHDDLLGEDWVTFADALETRLERDVAILPALPSGDAMQLDLDETKARLLNGHELQNALLRQSALLETATGRIAFHFRHPWSPRHLQFLETMFSRLRRLPVGCPARLAISSTADVPSDFGTIGIQVDGRISQFGVVTAVVIRESRAYVRLTTLAHYWLLRD